ncbi:hypothetical protein QQF73_18125 [Marinobacter sp. M216]|uniref:Big-1 domain-containing protein n=1 Tax=Marinobacter albus TaxID=3030833 RepID=A0ABT7HGQ7_9GAMM|nr:MULTISPECIES: hypothetical protein [unclassified Marinobacter]MBW7473049.1 hypothetical protein [Marinobacter sp. F4218]MDK9559558.1 hypothetical protein [Marinobacter sp. M216]
MDDCKTKRKSWRLEMSGKFLARTSAISLALILAACGGDDASAPLANSGSGNSSGSTGDATTDEGSTSTPETKSIAIGINSGSGFVDGQVSASTVNLGSGGKAYLEVTVVDQNDANSLVTGESIEVTFSSPCLDNARASLSANPVTVSSGFARTTYTAMGCAPQDLVTATVAGAEASVVLNIAPPEAVDLVASQPQPNSIAPNGQSIEGRKSVSKVTFTLEDESENGIPGSTVNFSLFPADTDLKLTQTSGETDDAGQVVASVEAGTTNAVVRVVATTTSSSGDTISTTSAPIAVNSYIPTEANFSLSIDNFLPNAMNIDGVTVGVTISAADRYGDAIRGNTIVNFTTSNGSITPDCELDDGGKCNVTWSSLATREARPIIYAYTQGERVTSGTDCFLPTSTCTYEPTTVEQAAAIVQSSSDNVTVSLANTSGNEYCATTSVVVRDGGTTASVVPPSGTTIEFTATDGTIINESQASKTIGTGSALVFETGLTTCVFAEANASPEGIPRLNVVVTPPGGDIAEAFTAL